LLLLPSLRPRQKRLSPNPNRSLQNGRADAKRRNLPQKPSSQLQRSKRRRNQSPSQASLARLPHLKRRPQNPGAPADAKRQNLPK